MRWVLMVQQAPAKGQSVTQKHEHDKVKMLPRFRSNLQMQQYISGIWIASANQLLETNFNFATMPF